MSFLDGYYQATIEFRPALQAQAEHVERDHQTARATIYYWLLHNLDRNTG